MKIGYLIVAHNNPEHLYRLVSHLKSENSKIFIHIDDLVDIEIFYSINGDNIYFIDDRVKSRWGTFSQTLATINLIKSALGHSDIERLQLLSGLDYPIKPIKELESFLDKSSHEFISINAEITAESKLFYRLGSFHAIDSELTNPRTRKNYKHLESQINELISSILNSSVTGFQMDRVFNLMKNYKIYKGSNWFNISSKCAQYCIDFINNNPVFVDTFRFTECSDEMFFHTIIGNSCFANSIYNKFDNNPLKNELKLYSGLHHVNWKVSPSPKVFQCSEDITELAETNAFFARKFSHQSSDLLNLIDSNLL